MQAYGEASHDPAEVNPFAGLCVSEKADRLRKMTIDIRMNMNDRKGITEMRLSEEAIALLAKIGFSPDFLGRSVRYERVQ